MTGDAAVGSPYLTIQRLSAALTGVLLVVLVGAGVIANSVLVRGVLITEKSSRGEMPVRHSLNSNFQQKAAWLQSRPLLLIFLKCRSQLRTMSVTSSSSTSSYFRNPTERRDTKCFIPNKRTSGKVLIRVKYSSDEACKELCMATERFVMTLLIANNRSDLIVFVCVACQNLISHNIKGCVITYCFRQMGRFVVGSNN